MIGIDMAAIQALEKRTGVVKSENELLKKENSNLKSEVDNLNARLKKVEELVQNRQY